MTKIGSISISITCTLNEKIYFISNLLIWLFGYTVYNYVDEPWIPGSLSMSFTLPLIIYGIVYGRSLLTWSRCDFRKQISGKFGIWFAVSPLIFFWVSSIICSSIIHAITIIDNSRDRVNTILTYPYSASKYPFSYSFITINILIANLVVKYGVMTGALYGLWEYLSSCVRIEFREKDENNSG